MDRNPVYDIMKGITIILVIIGHVSWLPIIAKKVIFSFHMPLFFILSGFFHKQSPLIRDVLRLIVPYIVTGLLIMFFHILAKLPEFDFGLLKEDILKIVWGSGTRHISPVGGRISAIGAVWFLLALFWCKRFYSLVSDRIENRVYLGLVCVVVSVLAIIIDNKVFNFPFAILPGFAALVFYFIGDSLKTVQKIPIFLIAVVSICWIVLIVCQPVLGLVNCTYHFYPLSVLGSCGGTYFMFILSKKLVHVGPVSSIFSLIGRISLPILCFHLFQLSTGFLLLVDNNIISLVSMIIIPILITMVLSMFESTRLIFGIPLLELKV